MIQEGKKQEKRKKNETLHESKTVRIHQNGCSTSIKDQLLSHCWNRCHYLLN